MNTDNLIFNIIRGLKSKETRLNTIRGSFFLLAAFIAFLPFLLPFFLIYGLANAIKIVLNYRKKKEINKARIINQQSKERTL